MQLISTWLPVPDDILLMEMEKGSHFQGGLASCQKMSKACKRRTDEIVCFKRLGWSENLRFIQDFSSLQPRLEPLKS